MDYLTAIIPSVGVLFLFVLAIRAMFQADRRERLAQARIEQEIDRAAAGAEGESPVNPEAPGDAGPAGR
jgi:hypothetical protein